MDKKGRMDRITSCRKVVAFCWLFCVKEQRKALKESLPGTFRLTFSVYAKSVLHVMFLLQAFTIKKLFDSNMEQGTDGLYCLRQPLLQWSNHHILIILLWKIYLWNHWIKLT